MTVRTLPALEPSQNVRWILSLAGGGYKGLFTAHFLSCLEEEVGPLHTKFDLIAGTSIGSILALGIASGASASSLAQLLEKHGKSIFPAWRRRIPLLLGTLLGPKYPQKALRAALIAQFADKTFSSLQTRALIPAVSLGNASARLFRSPHAAGFGDPAVSLVDAALASAAAPLYFPPHTVDHAQLADGGLIANAPHALAAIEAGSVLRWPLDDVHLLGVGTTEIPSGSAYKARKYSWGWLGWIRKKTLLNAMMTAQQELAQQSTKLMLPQRCTFVDQWRSHQQDKAVGLDVASKKATATLKQMAQIAWQAFAADANNKAVIELLRHRTIQRVDPLA